MALACVKGVTPLKDATCGLNKFLKFQNTTSDTILLNRNFISNLFIKTTC